jgi:hypothetical protein
MSPRRVEDHAAERNHEDITRIRRGVADDRHQDEHRREQFRRGEAEHPFQRRIDEAGMLRHAHAEQRNEHNAERMEAGERRHHVREKRSDRRPRELILDLDRLAVPRIDFAELHRREEPREDPDDEEQDEEERRGVGQLVADTLDRIQRAIDKARRAVAFDDVAVCWGGHSASSNEARCGKKGGMPAFPSADFLPEPERADAEERGCHCRHDGE